MAAPPISVGMSQIHVAKGPAVFQCLGLGSCIGLALFDPRADVAGMAHIVLPEAPEVLDPTQAGKYANSCLPEFLKLLQALGAEPRRILAAYSGGAQVFKFGSGEGSKLDIGGRNAAAVEAVLAQHRLTVVAKDVGGTKGRTVVYTTETGIYRIKTLATGEKDLCNLREGGSACPKAA